MSRIFEKYPVKLNKKRTDHTSVIFIFLHRGPFKIREGKIT